MRNLIIFMLLVGIFVLGKRSCHSSFLSWGVRGEGPLKTETRSVPDFHGVALDLAGDVDVTLSEQYSVVVEAQENLLPLLKTEVKDGILHLYFDESVSYSKDLRISVSAPSLDDFAVGGSGTIQVRNTVKTEKLTLNVSGSGDIRLEQIDVSSVAGDIGGSGGISLSGNTGNADFEVSGSGDVNAANLHASNCVAEISGSGTVNCGTVRETLKAGVSGSGDVFYSGSPSVDSNVSGSGSVEKK